MLVWAIPARAQWQTQTIELKAGWNAVFLHVDASHTTLEALIGSDANNPIIEVWRWNPPTTTQFTDSPNNPNPGSEWSSWMRTKTVNSLQRLVGDSAYLVRVGVNAPTYNWSVKGKPVPPRPRWTVTGLNLLGFSTVPVNPPRLDAFLARSPDLQSVIPEVFQYPGGELGPNNPMKIIPSLFRNVPVKRGQAFWIRAGDVFNSYFGPFEVTLSGTEVKFGGNLSTASLRLKNLITNSLDVTLMLANSETAPAGQTGAVGAPPLIVRGDFVVTNLSYSYTTLPVNGTRTWTLAPAGTPGSEVEVVVGLNRSAITTSPGALLAGVLRFKDSLGFSQVDVGVSATAATSAGLWVGKAEVNEVGHYLQTFVRNPDGSFAVSSNGSYIVEEVDTSLGAVPRSYPLRLIVHNPAVGNAVLLQRVFVGLDANTNQVLSLKETAIAPKFLTAARRLSSVHLPWTAANTGWQFNGKIATQTNLTTTVSLGYNDRESNPFVHAYHPDHDNLDTNFKNLLPQGSESYHVERQITLSVKPPGNDFRSLVSATHIITGTYFETITVKGLARAGGTNDTRQFHVRGDFSLNRISEIAQLTPAP